MLLMENSYSAVIGHKRAACLRLLRAVMKREFVLAAILSAFVVSPDSAQTERKQANNGSGGKDGGTCQVTGGANKGKTGTFSEGGTWCEGSWGGTECADSQGNSKCKSAAKGITRIPPGEIAVLQDYLEATRPGASPSELKAWQTKYKAKATKTAGRMVIKMPNQTLTFDGSSERLARRPAVNER
jgi:hypothetical protein